VCLKAFTGVIDIASVESTKIASVEACWRLFTREKTKGREKEGREGRRKGRRKGRREEQREEDE